MRLIPARSIRALDAFAYENCMTERLLALINEYQTRIREAVSLFQKYKDLDNPTHWRLAGLEQIGFLDPDKTIEYRFHGVGCWVKLPSGEVDWDFSRGDGNKGLQSWFLYMFATYGTDNFPEFKEKAVLDAAFNEAISQGILYHPSDEIAGEMYYLRDRDF